MTAARRALKVKVIGFVAVVVVVVDDDVFKLDVSWTPVPEWLSR